MSYKALYRTYRPADFHEVAGQNHITTTLQNALKSGKIQHAYLFSGPRGTGKTSIAKIFAKAVNCEKAPIDNPCNVCESCVGIQDGSISDVIEIDAASNNGVDEIREIRDKVKYLPGYVKYKVYIIDEVHMLSTGAFNALLKTLEEPPAHVIFILCTTEPQKIPLTIHSRCQRFDFKAITQKDIISKLKEISEKENIDIDSDALEQIAVYAEGGLRDAIGLLDQAYSYNPVKVGVEDVNQICGAVSYEKQMDIIESIIEMDSTNAIQMMNDLIIEGKEVPKIVLNLIEFFRDVLMLKNVGKTESQKSLYQNERFIQLAKALSNQRVFFYLDLLNKTQNDIKWSNNPKLYLELAFIKMTDKEAGSEAKFIDELSKLQTRIEELEKRPAVIVTEAKKTEPIVPQTQPVSEEVVTETPPAKEEVVSAPTEAEQTQPSLFDLGVEKTAVQPQTKCDDTHKTYPIEFVEEVLNNGDREDKIHLLDTWNRLSKNNASGMLNQYAVILESGTLVASSKDKIIITFPNGAACNRVMKPSSKKLCLDVLERAFGREIDFMALPEKVFQDITNEFASLWRQGKRKIKLSPIVCDELRDVSGEEDITKSEEPEKKVVTEAVKLFGDLVKVKK